MDFHSTFFSLQGIAFDLKRGEIDDKKTFSTEDPVDHWSSFTWKAPSER